MKSDVQMRNDVLSELAWDPAVTATDVGVIVKDGVVTLTGHPSSHAEKCAIEVAVSDLLGVTGVANQIVVKPKVTSTDIALKIQNALERQADREARRIEISVNGADVTLRGTVHSWAERNAAQGAAWSVPGVANVVNNLLVEA
ncbi:BON domain-containing protein [Variovorax rhizosphaerae]|uniref:BON domain-containing protein n=1 Tax=Variovorax rhizosphaerae TaxID=1836200 RepID=A0ABU8WVA0_9BURK